MRYLFIAVFLSFSFIYEISAQSVEDDFEGNGTIMNWFGDDCIIDTTAANPHVEGINTSATILSYIDTGGDYANVRFEMDSKFDMSSGSVFTLMIYVPSEGVTGNQPNQVSLKLQNGKKAEPWTTQSEVIKSITLDEWQLVTFDFLNDPYFSFDPNSPAPTQRTDFDRVVIQVNGENNNDLVFAYIDNISFDGVLSSGTGVDSEFDVLVWSDEFDGEGAINDSNWHHQTKLPNGGSWYNGEIQHYTDREDNSYVSDGILHIVGKKESFTNQGHTKQYTSARLNSKFAFQYGRVEVRAKLPFGVGTWPAIWTLGKNINEDGAYWDNEGFDTTSWPACGEIDIMEHWGANQNYISSATHTPSSFGGTINTGGQVLADASNTFHNYTLDWYPEKLVFSVDGIEHFTYEPSELNSQTWPFDLEQYILLNFAVLPSIDPNYTEDALEIDYVRVYQSSPPTSVVTVDTNNLMELKNAPNPASDYTIISFKLAESTNVKLLVYNINGQLIQTLADGRRKDGFHQVEWNTSELPHGIYTYRLETRRSMVSKKCVIE